MFEVGDIVVEVENSTCPMFEMHEKHWEFLPASRGYYRILGIKKVEDCPCVILLQIDHEPLWYCAGTFRKVTKANDNFIATIRKKVDA